MPRRSGPWPALAFLALLSSLPGPAAAGPEADAALCDQAVISGTRGGAVPQDVLRAIALTETGRVVGGRLRAWPWAVNREGRGYWFATREEALAFARRSLAEGRDSFDLGCFQINYHWHGTNFDSLESMLDPGQGAAYAARFLGALYAERGTWSAAAGAYHSQTPEKADVYRARFDRVRSGVGDPLTGPGLVTEPAPARVARAPIKPKIITLTPEGVVSGTGRETTAARETPAISPSGFKRVDVAEAL